MSRKKWSYLIIYFFLTYVNTSKAQQQLGQIVINTGVGYSPEFDGGIIWGVTPFYNVGTILDYPEYTQAYNNGNRPYYNFSSILPNLGGMIDVGLGKSFSIGVAGSYQNEMVEWNPTAGAVNPINSDKITRSNIAIRLLYHFQVNRRLDSYIGIRFGNSYWHDAPSATNVVTSLIPNQITFINNPSEINVSFQVLYGMRIYFNDFIGVHFEAGIGTPYLFEGGLTFKINPHKPKEVSK